MKKSSYEIGCVLITLLALSLGAANKIRLGPPPDAKPHLERVRDATGRVTGEVPGMIVTQGHLPRQAFELLRPNVLEARTYVELASNRSFSVLLVHCGDIKDMGAHSPPACYPGSGLKVVDTRPMPLELNGRVLNGVEYELQPSGHDDRGPLCIWNCMFLPGGTTTYDPVDLRHHARANNLRYYGSGQVQVLVRATENATDRIASYRQAISIYQTAIDQMLSDPRKPSVAATR